jgi:hypothetical protein
MKIAYGKYPETVEIVLEIHPDCIGDSIATL